MGVLAYLRARVLSKARTAVRLLRAQPRRFVSAAFGRIRIYKVFSAPLLSISQPEPVDSLAFVRLSSEELRQLASARTELCDQLEYLDQLGDGRCYGLFLGGRLAHLSWAVCGDDPSSRGVSLLDLRPGELEICHAYTLPEFRGRGLYPYAIRSLCNISRNQGHRVVYMITERANRSSQRGILKAGLRKSGWLVRIVPPLAPSSRGWVIRSFRRAPSLLAPPDYA